MDLLSGNQAMGPTERMLCEFIETRQLGSSTGARIDVDVRLFDDDVIDSMSLLEIIEFIEQEFDVQIGEQDLVAENFATVRALANLIDRLRR